MTVLVNPIPTHFQNLVICCNWQVDLTDVHKLVKDLTKYREPYLVWFVCLHIQFQRMLDVTTGHFHCHIAGTACCHVALVWEGGCAVMQ